MKSKNGFMNFDKIKALLKPYESDLNLPEGKKLEDIKPNATLSAALAPDHDDYIAYTLDCKRMQLLGLQGIKDKDLNDVFGWDYEGENFYFELRDFTPAPLFTWHWFEDIAYNDLKFLDQFVYMLGDFPTADILCQISSGKHQGKLAYISHDAVYAVQDIIDTLDKKGTVDEMLEACSFIEILDEFEDVEDYFLQRLSGVVKKATEEEEKEEVATTLVKQAGSSILNLSGTKLKEIPDHVFEMVHLTELDLSENNIKEVGDMIGVLTNLEVLKLNNNKITTISPEISKLQKLRVLTLANNQFKGDIPAYLVEFENLEELSLMMIAKLYRDVLTMPTEIFKLKKLEKFSNGGLCFTNYPTTYGSEGNPLNMEPNALASHIISEDSAAAHEYIFSHGDSKTILKLLETYYDAEDKTMNFSELVMSKLPKEILDFDIEILNMSKCSMGIGTDIHKNGGTSKAIRNKFSDIHAENLSVLSEMITLQELEMEGNGLLALPDLSKLTKLKRLVIDRNSLIDIPGLSKLTQLEHLDFSGNEFPALPDGLFELTALKVLQIEHGFEKDTELTIEDFSGIEKFINLEKFVSYNSELKSKLKKLLPKKCELY